MRTVTLTFLDAGWEIQCLPTTQQPLEKFAKSAGRKWTLAPCYTWTQIYRALTWNVHAFRLQSQPSKNNVSWCT